MNLIVATPSIAPHIQQTVTAYHEAGLLAYFYTSFIEHPQYPLSSFLKKFGPFGKEINRRSFHSLPIEKFQTRPFPELLRSISARQFGPIITDHLWHWAELGFDQWVSKKISAPNINAVHTYEHAALETLKIAKALKLFSIYEQPSQHHSFFTNIAKAQIELYPELKSSKTSLLIDKKAEQRNKRRDAELDLASLVICNSTFTKRTLVAGGVSADKIRVIPLGFPPVTAPNKVFSPGKPTVFMYAGNQSLRKASHLLYKAWSMCNFSENEAQLLLIGKMALPEHLRQNLPGKVIIKDNVPHHELMEIYKDTDVFILPTLADGFGMVVTEAMSQGVPVIASENSCGPDVIDHMQNGWIIPAGEVGLLAEQMKWCVNNPEKVASLGQAARQKALEWQWPQYRKKLTDTILEEWQKFEQKKRFV